MAATYDDTLPADLDRARLALGDINTDAPLRQDEHIEAAIDANGYNLGVAILAEGLAAEYAQQVTSFSAPGAPSVSWAERVAQWNRTAAHYRALYAREAAAETAQERISMSVRNRAVW